MGTARDEGPGKGRGTGKGGGTGQGRRDGWVYLIGECGAEAQRPVALELGPHGHGGRGQHPRMAAVVVEVQLGMSVGAHSNHGPRVVPVAPQNIEALNEVSKGGSALRR